MSNIYKPKEVTESKILSNIRFVKIIAIILGLLIILGLFVLFIGLTKSYNNLDNDKNINLSLVNNTEIELKVFNFSQPLDAQLISSSLGADNKILLRYLYKGDNVLVIIDSKSNEMESITKLKKKKQAW